VVDFVKNSITGSSSNDGELTTSTSAPAPLSASPRPSPVSTSTPDARDAATTSWLSAVRRSTTFVPIRPLAPITVIFM
jgi:hypothetical protein